MNTITVIRPGLMALIQDTGRFGAQGSGIPVSGCMDQRALAEANSLLGNPPGEAVIEMLYQGAAFRFDCHTVVALTGADMNARLNDRSVPAYTALPIRPGDTLILGAARSGRYGYLGVAGGFALPPVLGSLSTYVKCGIGGFQGRALRSGDVLPLRCETWQLPCAERKPIMPRAFAQDITVRIVPGPQEDLFSADALRTLFSASYRVTDQSDRMGFRLDGPPLSAPDGTDIISDGTALGSIQVPGSGKPIILLADRQTTGGYAKIGTVITPDLPKLVQCMPGAVIRFTPVSARRAQALYRKEQKQRRLLGQRSTWEDMYASD